MIGCAGLAIDFEVAHGEMLAVLGTNGAGKSTLMRAISGLVVPSAGEVLFDGKPEAESAEPLAEWEQELLASATATAAPAAGNDAAAGATESTSEPS